MTDGNGNRANGPTELLVKSESRLGEPWVPVYNTKVTFDASHFVSAMSNLIKQPNINSTVIMRADILSETSYNTEGESLTSEVNEELIKAPDFPPTSTEDHLLHRYLDDILLRQIPLQDSLIKLTTQTEIVRRIMPRNPYKDHIINQTCLVLRGVDLDAVLVVYVPHIKCVEETPFYLPPVYGVGILYYNGELSVNYLPFEVQSSLRELDESDRAVRIALRLLQTSQKHSQGVQNGYEKRVTHDVVVPREAFQNRYIALKKKYLAKLVQLWVESTDPKKHVFEDLAIAAFLIELWSKMPSKPEFRDLGCGNGLLVYVLMMEGFKGKGIDARARKTWKTFPKEVQDNLLEQVIIPSVLLKPHPAVAKFAPHVVDNGRLFQIPEQPTAKNPLPLVTFYTSSNLLELTQVCTADDFPTNTFIIGNHLDELTCWIPLFGYPFAVIPCCSHALSGAKCRFNPRKTNKGTNASAVSRYGCLVDHVEELSRQMGWEVEKEMLRIPSTRNAAVIGLKKQEKYKKETADEELAKVYEVVAMEGGAEGWVENTMALMKRPPRNH